MWCAAANPCARSCQHHRAFELGLARKGMAEQETSYSLRSLAAVSCNVLVKKMGLRAVSARRCPKQPGQGYDYIRLELAHRRDVRLREGEGESRFVRAQPDWEHGRGHSDSAVGEDVPTHAVGAVYRMRFGLSMAGKLRCSHHITAHTSRSSGS